jgi:transposase
MTRKEFSQGKKSVLEAKNKYSKRSKISEVAFRHLLMLFELDLTAKKMAELCQLNRNTINRYMTLIRKRITQEWETINPLAPIPDNNIVFEPEKNTFYGKVVLGIFEENNTIYTKLLQFNPDWSEKNIVVMQLKFIDGFRKILYATLMEFKSDLCAMFCIFTHERLKKFRGISKNTLLLHLKECEVRFNQKKHGMYDYLIKIFHINPL